MLAAATADAPPSRRRRAMWSKVPAPPDAITGIETACADAADQVDVVAVHHAVALDRLQEDLARAQRFDASARRRPDRARSRSSGPREDFAPAWRRTSIETTTHCEPNRSAHRRTMSGVRRAAVFDHDLVGADLQQAADVVDGSDAAADRERHEALVGQLVDQLESRATRPSAVAVTSRNTSSSTSRRL